jgi:putative mRNA 3-end processing factor
VQEWIVNNQASGHHSVFYAYSLGKAQRIADAASRVSNHIYVHGSVWNIHQSLRDAGIPLPEVKRMDAENKKQLPDHIVVIAPASAADTPWIQQSGSYRSAFCSGWMQIRGQAKRNPADTGFAISDHADWNGLISTIQATGAEKVFVTHGFTSVFSRYLSERGIHAAELSTEFGKEDENIISATQSQQTNA